MARRDRTKDRVPPELPLGSGAVSDRESVVWRFIAIYLVLVLIGFVVFRHPSAMVRGNEMSVDRAMFTSINAATLTGFQQTLALDEYRWPGKIAALLLTIGGTLTALVGGGMAVSRIARLGWSDRTIVIAACATEAIVMLVGGLALLRGRGGFDALLLAVSTFGHSGLHVGVLPDAEHPMTHLVLMPLALIGGLGIPVLLSLGVALRRRAPLPEYVRLVLALWAGSYLIGVLALVALGGGSSFQEALVSASLQSINSRTTGLPYPLGDARSAHWLVMLLMAAGGVSGAAAGGVKLTTLWRLFTGGRAVVRGAAPGRVFGIAMLWIGAFAALVFVTTLGLLATEPGQPGDRLLFLALSAVSNVGLAHNPVSIVGTGMFILSGAMLLGRILPLVVLWWVVDAARDQEEIPVG